MNIRITTGGLITVEPFTHVETWNRVHLNKLQTAIISPLFTGGIEYTHHNLIYFRYEVTLGIFLSTLLMFRALSVNYHVVYLSCYLSDILLYYTKYFHENS